MTDMMGRRVAVADRIGRVATLGAVPVINSFLFALGAGDRIVNGLPPAFALSPRWKFQLRFAPAMAGKPVLQGADFAADTEAILAAAPDVVLTMNRASVAALVRLHVPTLLLAWDNRGDIRRLMTLLGELLGRREQAAAYLAYFDRTLGAVARLTAKAPSGRRPKVLYCDFARLTQPHLVAEWWIAEAGGRSVTDNGRKTESVTFSLEQMLAWNPEVLVVSDPKGVDSVYADERLRRVRAVVARRVFATPVGAHLWSQRTAEQPLMVLWAAKHLYPDRFAPVDVAAEARSFYRRFFGVELSNDDIAEILSGISGSLPSP